MRLQRTECIRADRKEASKQSHHVPEASPSRTADRRPASSPSTTMRAAGKEGEGVWSQTRDTKRSDEECKSGQVHCSSSVSFRFVFETTNRVSLGNRTTCFIIFAELRAQRSQLPPCRTASAARTLPATDAAAPNSPSLRTLFEFPLIFLHPKHLPLRTWTTNSFTNLNTITGQPPSNGTRRTDRTWGHPPLCRRL
jgi:hypothetical protein